MPTENAGNLSDLVCSWIDVHPGDLKFSRTFFRERPGLIRVLPLAELLWKLTGVATAVTKFSFQPKLSGGWQRKAGLAGDTGQIWRTPQELGTSCCFLSTSILLSHHLLCVVQLPPFHLFFIVNNFRSTANFAQGASHNFTTPHHPHHPAQGLS
jgi:hypothetical protein